MANFNGMFAGLRAAAADAERVANEAKDPRVYQRRREEIVSAWHAHIGHDHGGNYEGAMYDASLGQTYIRCCVKRCKWSYEIKEGGR